MRKLYTTLSLLLATTLTALAVPTATFSWALGGGGATGSDYAADVAIDNSGNIFTAASFLSSATFNGVTVTGAAKGSGASFDKSLLITKMSPAKDNLWKIISNDGVFNPVAIATTSDGSLIVTGSVRAVKNTAGQTTTANIVDAAGTVTSFSNLGNLAADVQTVVAKFNTSGVVQWVKEINSSATKDTLVEPSALLVDANGDIILSGVFTKTAIFQAPTPITISTTNTIQGVFVAKLNGTTGDAVYARTTSGGVISESLTALALDADGVSVYYAGAAKNLAVPVAVNVGPTLSYTPTSSTCLLIMKLDASGTPVFVQSRASLSADPAKGDIRVKDIVVKDGKFIVGGSFQGSYGGYQFPGGALTASAAYLNGFLAAFNGTDGTDVWQKAITAPAITEINGLAIGFDGRVWAHGYTYNALGTTIAAGDCSFGNGVVLTDATNKLGDLFLASFVPSNGWAVEAHWAGKGTGSETANALTASGSNLYLVSTTNSVPITFEIATNTYTRLGSFDFVLQNYSVPSTGVNQVRTDAVSCYNELASRSVVVKNAGEFASVSLFDLTGRKVGTSLVVNGEVRFNNLQQGIYVVGATKVNGSRVSVKVAVQ
jgi:hypothetical protein